MKQFDLIVIGGGAAGLIASGTAAKEGAQVLLIERNTRMARKVMITGKGRCNLTNHCSEDIPQPFRAQYICHKAHRIYFRHCICDHRFQSL